jgi:drug/metabolite transporter (DMT)-like permease
MITEVGDRGREYRPMTAGSSVPPLEPAGRATALPSLALLLVAVTWGVAFSVVDEATATLPAADLVAWRFGLGAGILLLIRRSAPALPTPLRRRAVALGGLLGAGFLLQTWALSYTDAVLAGFLVGTLVIIAPITSWLLFGDRIGPMVCCSVALASIGLALLSLRGNGFGPGEAITLTAAGVWALHLVLLARWARPEHALQLARIQTSTVAALALLTVAVLGWVTGGPVLPAVPASAETWLSVAFLAVLATAAAMIALSWAQSRLSATRAAVILTLEPAAAGVTGALLGSEFGGRTIAGGVLLVLAMLLVEMGSVRSLGRHRARRARGGPSYPRTRGSPVNRWRPRCRPRPG